MALRITEFFGYPPLHPAGLEHAKNKTCPFVHGPCIKPNHGACTLQQISGEPVVCCPNRLYAENYKILADIAEFTFGHQAVLVNAVDAKRLAGENKFQGNEVVVFGRYWGRELPLPTPPGATRQASRNYYVDWILAKVSADGTPQNFVAVEVQTIDTTGNYSDQVEFFFKGEPYTDPQGRAGGYSNAGMNWENVNKRILPQLIYKGHVLRGEEKCQKGLFFVCPVQVYNRIQERLGGSMRTYHPGNGTITFRSYALGEIIDSAKHRELVFSGQFTTTVDQVALAFTSPMNLPPPNVYEKAIKLALDIEPKPQ